MGNQEFVHMSRSMVANRLGLRIDQVYVVWVVKVLKNNKAMLSTTEEDGLYFEITYNGEKEEFYIDKYKKEKNEAVKLENWWKL